MFASCINYAIGRFAGGPLARRLVGEEDMKAAQARAARTSALLLFGTRPVPVVGEVILVAAGIARYPFRRFVLAVGAANAVLAPFYAGLPTMLGESDPERLLTIAAIGVPAAAALAYGLLKLGRKLTA